MKRHSSSWNGTARWLVFSLAILIFSGIWYVSWMAGSERIVAVLLDYKTLQVQQVWQVDVRRCAPFSGLSDKQLIETAEDLLETHYSAAGVDYLGSVSLLTLSNGDFSGLALLAACDAQPIFAGTIIWAGRGRQVYPPEPESSQPVGLRETAKEEPAKYVSLVVPTVRLSVSTSRAREVWAVASRVEALSTTQSRDVKVLVLLYPESVGPIDETTTHFIVFVIPK